MSYGIVSETFWNDLTVRKWSDDARLAALYLLTNPHRSFEGFYSLSLRLAADDMGWPDERLQIALRELTKADFVDVDEEARSVLILKALKYQTIRGAKSIKGAINALERTNGSPRLFARYLEAADAYQPELAAAIRVHYGLPDGPYQGPPKNTTQAKPTEPKQVFITGDFPRRQKSSS